MFTKDEKDVLKELIIIEIENVQETLKESSKMDEKSLEKHQNMLKKILEKLD